jgi:hypothetical protein
MFWGFLRGLFAGVKMEEPGSAGNLDLLVPIGNNTYAVIEVKYENDIHGKYKDVNTALNSLAHLALKTISEKKYGQRYRVPGNTVIDVGLGVFGRGEALALFRDS